MAGQDGVGGVTMKYTYVGDYYFLDAGRDQLGAGAFAQVFKGKRRNSKPDEFIAIKRIVNKALDLSKQKNKADAQKEIEILKQLSTIRHPHLVQMLDSHKDAKHFFVIMEYCNGGDLSNYLSVKGTLSEDTIVHFSKQIASALQRLFNNDPIIIHRDIKPQNILLCHSGRASNPDYREITLKLADFGFARFLNPQQMAETMCGSPLYMAPEVLTKSNYDARADLFSVGAITYQMLTGEPPFKANTPQELQHKYVRATQLKVHLPPGTSEDLADLLQGLLQKHMANRLNHEMYLNHPFINRPAVGRSPPVRTPSRTEMLAASASRLASVFARPSPPQPPAAASPPRRSLPRSLPSPPNRVVHGFAAAAATPAAPAAAAAARARSSVLSGVDDDMEQEDEDEDFVLVSRDIPLHTDQQISPGSPAMMDELTQSDASGSSTSQRQSCEMARHNSSQPIPVPTQKKHYERLRNSGRSPSPVCPQCNSYSPRASPSSPKIGSAPSRFLATPPQVSPQQNVTFGLGPPPPSSVKPRTRRASVGTAPYSNQRNPAQDVMPASASNAVATMRYHRNRTVPDRLSGIEVWTQHSSTMDSIAEISFTDPAAKKFNSLIPSAPSPGLLADLTAASPPQSFVIPSSSPSGSPHHSGESMGNSNALMRVMIPQLAEDSILSIEHRTMLNRLTYVHALAESIVELMNIKNSVFTSELKLSSRHHFEPHVEELLLLRRVMSLLELTLLLTRTEVTAGRLHCTANVKSTFADMMSVYGTCLARFHAMEQNRLLDNLQMTEQEASDLTDDILFDYALALSREGVFLEMHNKAQECPNYYRTAMIILHSLAQKAEEPEIKIRLESFLTCVEKRFKELKLENWNLA